MIGHLRDVKDPLRAAEAARLLPADSRVRIEQVGRAYTPQWAARARAEMAANPRYLWRDDVPAAAVRRLLARSHAMVISSLSEGGANVISEAAVAGVPILASRMDGNVGLLGADYPGYFPVGDTQALARLLRAARARAALRGAARQGVAPPCGAVPAGPRDRGVAPPAGGPLTAGQSPRLASAYPTGVVSPTMIRARAFLWLVALIAFAVPTLGTASMAHAAAFVERAVSTDCPEHAPPPDPCPEHGTSKHAAGLCCPLMSAAVALLPATMASGVRAAWQTPPRARSPSLVGRFFTQDPPPPRV